MNKLLGGLLVMVVWGGSGPLIFGQTVAADSTAAATDQPTDAGASRAREFQADDLAQVLRLLARQAKISAVIGEAVKGSVSVRLENATALGAIEILVRQYKLSMNKDDKGVYYLNAPEAADATLDLLAKPETANRVAAYTHNFYAALIKEGFTTDEALKIVTASDLSQIIATLKKTEVATQK